MFFTASDFTSITSYIHNWALVLLWLHPFILSGVISPLISSSILGTYRPGEFIFQCPIFLPFHTGVGSLSLLQGIFPTQGSNPCLPHCKQNIYLLSFNGSPRILEWTPYPFSSGPHSVRPLYHDPPVLGCPQAWLGFIELDKAVVLV